MKCHIVWHFIWVFNVARVPVFGVSGLQRVKLHHLWLRQNTIFLDSLGFFFQEPGVPLLQRFENICLDLALSLESPFQVQLKLVYILFLLIYMICQQPLTV